MTEEHLRQLESFFTEKLGDGWQAGAFVHLNGWQVVEALWPMNEVFRQHHAQVSSLSYLPSYAAEADQALGLLAHGGAWTATEPGTGAWRVLLERHVQSIMLALANHLQGNVRVMSVPKSLKSKHYKLAAMLFLQWGMVLPFPIENRSSFPWPAGSAPGNLRQH